MHREMVVYALITGIQKIRATGAERRAFVRWMKAYSQEDGTYESLLAQGGLFSQLVERQRLDDCHSE